jgi:hypothetical protein
VDGPGTISGGTPEPHGAALLYAQAVAGGGCASAVDLWSDSFRGDDTFDEAVTYCEEIDAGLPEFTSVIGLDEVIDRGDGEAIVVLNLGGTDAPAQVRVVEQADGWWFDGPVHGGPGSDDPEGGAVSGGDPDQDLSTREEECGDLPPHPEIDDPEVLYQACLNGELDDF